MSEPTKAVFLSYASQDAEVAKRIADALRSAGVEVWFDQSELRGGDAWDAMIRRRIKECALFVPVITPTTNARAEGYFRLEWKLAVDRSHLMADDAPFLFPVVIGDVTDATARVPDKFREVQWTRLRLDETPGELAGRVARLLSGSLEAGRSHPAGRGEGSASPRKYTHWMRNLGMIMGLTIGLVYAFRPLWLPDRRSPPKPAAVAVVAPNAPAPVSEARKNAERARALFDKLDSNADDFAVAESLLKRALELDATDGEIWAYSARLNAAYLTRGFERGTTRAEAARNHAERAVKLAPESAEAWHALGRAIWRSDPPRAEEALRHALLLAPDDGRILISLGSIYRNQGRDEEALAFYVRAAARPEVRPLALYDQFLIHLYLRRFEEADRCGREAAAALPTTNSITGLAILEIVWRGRVDSAQRTLAAAPAAMRSEPRMVFATALAALMAKQSDEALRALDRLPGDFISDAWYSGPKALLVGLAHTQAGRPEAARIAWEAGLAVVRRRLEESSNDPELHLRLGELLAWTGQAEPALREARVFEELARTRTDWTFSSARIYAALGRADDAVPILEKFLSATATGRWPLTPTLLRLDPLWDKIRGDPRFQKLCAEPATQTTASAANSTTVSSAALAKEDKSVAVLAFANLSDDRANEYFSDGISEELLNVLAKIPGLKVSARTSAFYFKGKEVPIPEIARQLGVAYVVEGSVRKAGDKVRISAQLIKAADGFHVWSDTFTRDVKDIFAVQDEIAGLIAKNLSLKLGSRPSPSAVVLNPQAFEAYVQARQLWSRRTIQGFAQAEQLLNRALELDPDFTRARAALADVSLMRGYREQKFGSYGQRGSPAYDKLLEQINAVLTADPNLAEAYATLGMVRQGQWDYAEGEKALRRSVELNPNYATGRQWLGMLLVGTGRIDEGLAELKLAAELDPLSFIILDNYGWVLWMAGRNQEALDYQDRALTLNPGFEQTSFAKAMNLVHMGRLSEAAALVGAGLKWPLDQRIMVLGRLGLLAEAEALLPGLAERSPFDRFGAWLSLGRTQEAWAALDGPAGTESVAYGDTLALLYLPLYDPVRQEPRFVKMLETLGLTEAHARAQAWRKAHPPQQSEAKK